MKEKNYANIDTSLCVACGSCLSICPMQAIKIAKGCYAQVDVEKCVGCQKCIHLCPASIIRMEVSHD